MIARRKRDLMPDDHSFAERSFRTADGLSLFYREYGSRVSGATPILCLAANWAEDGASLRSTREAGGSLTTILTI